MREDCDGRGGGGEEEEEGEEERTDEKGKVETWKGKRLEIKGCEGEYRYEIVIMMVVEEEAEGKQQ